MRLIKAKDYQEASRQVANIISAQVILRPDSVLGLATGSSPIGAYRQLIEWYNKGDVDFSRVRSVNLDEYVGLAPSHEQSYAYFMHHNFFDFINIKPENVHLPDGLDPDAEGQGEKYDALIRSLGGVDLQLLGIGRDGHIGFNEPCGEFVKGTHCVELTQDTREANARFFGSVDLVPKTAYTMGILDIMQARRVVMIASGSSKAAIVRDAFWGPVTPQIPASILQLHPDFTLVADEEALATVNQEKQAG
jgi:glucosamine-6-phosphate deaminase